jgi:isoleucyl-tRNA synthetase
LDSAADLAKLPELERWALHRLGELDAARRKATEDHVFTSFYTALHTFCAVDLSAFYFDIRKDSLYCDAVGSQRRRAVRSVLDRVYHCLVTWLAPVLCFTAEEAWLARHPGDGETVHKQLFPAIPAAWRNDDLAARWSKIRDLRRVVTGALEKARAEKKIGASLQAHPVIYVDKAPDEFSALSTDERSEMFITSGHDFKIGPAPAESFQLPDVPGIAVQVNLADGQKCERCWRVLPDVGTHAEHPTLCARCDDVVSHLPAAAP